MAGGKLDQIQGTVERLEAYAKERGCDYAAPQGREGWLRALPGYQRAYRHVQGDPLMGGLTTPKGGETKSTTQVNQVPACVQAAQGNLLNAANGILSPYLQQQGFTTAPLNSDQTGAYDRVRQLAQGAFTNPSAGNGNAAPAAPTLNSVTGTGYTPTPTQATGYSSASFDPSGYTGAGYVANTASAVGYDPRMATAAQVTGADISALMNPFVAGVVDTTNATINRDQPIGPGFGAFMSGLQKGTPKAALKALLVQAGLPEDQAEKYSVSPEIAKQAIQLWQDKQADAAYSTYRSGPAAPQMSPPAPGGPAAGASMNGGPALTGSLGDYARAIQSNESGGNYQALGPVTRTGDRAYGACQVILGGSGRIIRLRGFTDDPDCIATIRVHLMKTLVAPTVGDNAPASKTVANAALGYGYADLTFSAGAVANNVFSNGAKGYAANVPAIAFDVEAGTQNIYALLEARTAFTPKAGQRLGVSLESDLD